MTFACRPRRLGGASSLQTPHHSAKQDGAATVAAAHYVRSFTFPRTPRRPKRLSRHRRCGPQPLGLELLHGSVGRRNMIGRNLVGHGARAANDRRLFEKTMLGRPGGPLKMPSSGSLYGRLFESALLLHAPFLGTKWRGSTGRNRRHSSKSPHGVQAIALFLCAGEISVCASTLTSS